MAIRSIFVSVDSATAREPMTQFAVCRRLIVLWQLQSGLKALAIGTA